jgi:uncharacterized protein (TIGR02246 family)
MKFRNHFPQALLPAASALVVFVFTQPQVFGQDKAAGAQPADKPEQADKPDDAIETLGLAARRFVAAFNGRDAAAIAGLFMPNGEIRGHDGTIISGREEIETFYKGIFAADSVPGIALEASSVHFISPDIAIEDGVVHFTYAEDEPVRSISYSATQLRQADGSWLTAISRDKLEVTPPSEQIKPLRWLIGEWTLEGEDGLRVDMAIHPDERENYLLGEALITTAEGDAQSTSLRIGWNPATSSIHWWNFDSDGGHTTGQWTRQDDHWLIQNSGVTAANETTSSSQSLARDGADSMVWVATNRTVAGETLPAISFRFVRRAPAPGSSLTNDGN